MATALEVDAVTDPAATRAWVTRGLRGGRRISASVQVRQI